MKKKILLVAIPSLFALVAVGGIKEAVGAYAEGTTPTYVVLASEGTEGLMAAANWTGVETYAMTGTGEGTVSFATVGTKLIFKMNVVDTTKLTGKDKIDYTFTVGTKTQGQQGNFDPWLTALGAMDYGNNIQTDLSYDDATTSYTAVIGFDLKTDFVEGLEIGATVNFHNASGTQSWGEGDAISFSHSIFIGKDPSREGLVPGPKNEDLGIVVTDLAALPTDDDWAKATAIDMIPVYGDTTGATATVKLLSANKNIFWKMEITDPAINNGNEGLYLSIATVEETPELLYEGRGNFDMWIAEKVNKLSSPSLFTQSIDGVTDVKGYQAGTLTYNEGFYMPNQAIPDGKIHLNLRFRDSRSAAEAWKDGDYVHTVYFDQTITFGAEADKTIRPQTATDGFTGSAVDISYNKGTIEWADFGGADSYKLFIYEKNADGAEEPYTYLRTDGPVYGGEKSYSEIVTGLSEETAYAVQIVALDEKEAVTGYSSLVNLVTTARGTGGGSSSSSSSSSSAGSSSSSSSSSSSQPTSSSTPASSSSSPASSSSQSSSSSQTSSTGTGGGNGGCGGAIAGTAAVGAIALGAALFIAKKRKKN